MIKPMLVGAGIGAVSSYAMGQDPVKGAALGGATAGFGSAMSPSAAASGATGGFAQQGMVTPTLTGNALGQGGMNTVAGQGLMASSSPTIGGSGLLSSVPETAGGYSDLLGGDSMLQNYDMGMNGVESQLNTFSPENIGSVNGTNAGIDYPDFSAPPAQSSNGYVLSPEEIETAANLKQYGGLETPVTDDEGFLNSMGLGSLEEYLPTKRDMGSMAITQGVEALTPEEEEILRHQQAMVMRGQTGSMLGQGGNSIGGQFISRAR